MAENSLVCFAVVAFNHIEKSERLKRFDAVDSALVRLLSHKIRFETVLKSDEKEDNKSSKSTI